MPLEVLKDLAPERHDRIAASVQHHGAVRVDELSREIGVSAATIRRDLESLEQQGRIRRVHGGAVRIESRLDEPLFDDKATVATREKQRIAEKALTLVREAETLYLDGGSTVLEVARLLRDRPDVTVVTNSLRAAIELAGQGPRLILAGGELRRRSQTVVGALTRHLLETVHVDKAFMGTMGMTLEEGMTTTDPDEAFTKELIMQRAEQVVLLMDSSKAGKVSFAHAGAIRDVDIVISDTGFPQKLARPIRKRGVTLYTV